MNPIEIKYIKAFGKLNRATKNGKKAPHKPILLISIIDLIITGEIKQNKIRITPELVSRFKDYWSLLVKDSFFKANFSLPFYHLKSDQFWHLTTLPRKEIILTSSNSIKSFSHLCDAIDYASFNNDLFLLLLNPSSQRTLRNYLLDTYFGIRVDLIPDYIFKKIELEILKEAPPHYQKLIENSDEEELFVRSGAFKKTIPKIYNHTCCITRHRIISGYDMQMIDACHIVPFANSHDDTISNGICLSPTFHRAFDRGLISINEDYKVIVSSRFSETGSDISLKSYDGKSIFIPSIEKYKPSFENLKWHRDNVFKG